MLLLFQCCQLLFDVFCLKKSSMIQSVLFVQWTPSCKLNFFPSPKLSITKWAVRLFDGKFISQNHSPRSSPTTWGSTLSFTTYTLERFSRTTTMRGPSKDDAAHSCLTSSFDRLWSRIFSPYLPTGSVRPQSKSATCSNRRRHTTTEGPAHWILMKLMQMRK